MKKLVIKAIAALLIVGEFKIVVVEPDKPHTFEVTIPAFTNVVEFFDIICNETEKLVKDFEVTLQNNASCKA